MSRNLRTPSRWAFTLVEILAGTALAGTLLVVLLAAATQHLHQVRSAQLRLQAVELLDRQLTDWMVAGTPIPDTGTGRLNTDLPLWWSAERRPVNESLRSLEAIVVRLEVQERRRGRAARRVASVDLLIPAR